MTVLHVSWAALLGGSILCGMGMVVCVGTAYFLRLENRYLEEVILLNPQRSRAIIHQGPRNLGHAGLEPLSSVPKLTVASKLRNRWVFRQGPPSGVCSECTHPYRCSVALEFAWKVSIWDAMCFTKLPTQKPALLEFTAPGP